MSMIDLEKARFLSQKLRCQMAVPACKTCEGCEYRLLEEITPDFPVCPDVTIDGIGYWEGCDYERIYEDAAELLESIADD